MEAGGWVEVWPKAHRRPDPAWVYTKIVTQRKSKMDPGEKENLYCIMISIFKEWLTAMV